MLVQVQLGTLENIMAHKNQLDSNGSFEMGNVAEELFKKTAIENRFIYFPSTAYTDMKEHVDCVIYKCNEREYGVEIKGLKRISRSGEPQDKQIWIELHGVNQGNDGWLFGGHADIIAFQTKTGFYLVKRTELIKLVNGLVNFNIIVDYPEQAQFCIYQRSGRLDKLTLIPTCLLKTIWNIFWSTESW